MSSFVDDTESLVLKKLVSDGLIADTMEFAEAHGIDHQELVGTIKSLLVDAYVIDEPISKAFWVLTSEGEQVALKGSPEYQVYQAVPNDSNGITMAQLQTIIGDMAKIGLGPCMKNKWLKKQGESVIKTADNVIDETSIVLSKIKSGSYSDIPEDEQALAFEPCKPDEVKVIIATNAAESSLTLPDVDYVICLGQCKSIRYDSVNHKNMLLKLMRFI
jgi:hypothetical protein